MLIMIIITIIIIIMIMMMMMMIMIITIIIILITTMPITMIMTITTIIISSAWKAVIFRRWKPLLVSPLDLLLHDGNVMNVEFWICQKKEMASLHYSDVIMSSMASRITGISIVYSTVSSGADQRKCQSSASLAFVRGIHRWPVNSPHRGPITREMFPFDDVIMRATYHGQWHNQHLKLIFYYSGWKK